MPRLMPEYSTLITAADLHERLGRSDWAVVDCRFDLAHPAAGRIAYTEAHIPGAIYAHIEEDLSAPVVAGTTGRHPLPSVEEVMARLGAWGIDEQVQVAAYDDSGGSMAVRLWWILRWLGHDRVAVLDGGWLSWTALGYPVQAGVETREPRVFVPRPRRARVADAEAVTRALEDPTARVLDARRADRFRGENESIDPVAGRIPGAVSAPYADNLDASGRFLAREELKQRFARLLDDSVPERAICYCGSGITAAHDILAMVHAGLGEPRLYAGSWSEWITDPARPVARGPAR